MSSSYAMKNNYANNNNTHYRSSEGREIKIKYKGPIEACKIIALLNDDFPNFKLVIIGDGPFKHKVEQFVEDNKLPVIFTGYLDKLENYLMGNWSSTSGYNSKLDSKTYSPFNGGFVKVGSLTTIAICENSLFVQH